MNVACPNCSTSNETTDNFCSTCGTSLPEHCSDCGTPLPAGARFCPSCGHLATGAADQDRLSKLAAATPPPLAEKMRTTRLTGERRIVTSLFADVVSSTTLAEQMDPEEWAIIISHAFERFSRAIYRYEGTIARLLGDALLAFFGAPVAHEDDPVRAVRAALDLVGEVRAYAQEVNEAYGIDFAVRVGLSTGPVVVGNISSDLLFDYTALGDSVNLAARLESLARPMGILISESTYRSVVPFVEVADLGEREIKGKRAPVHLYEVLGTRATSGRLRGLSELKSPLVGRANELAQLLALSGVVQAGLGRVAVIVGEPGLGKSRLVAEWRAAADPSLRWVEGHCLSYGSGLADHLVIDLLRALLGVGPSAGGEETQAALRELIDERFGPQASEVYPYLADLLSLELDDEARHRIEMLEPQVLRTRYGTALERLLQAEAAHRPLVLVLEDLHWADPSSTDLLARLLPLARAHPLLFCLVTRPGRSMTGWKLVDSARDLMGAGLTELWLEPLPETASDQLVANLLEIEALPAPVRRLILGKAEGNPYFVEELIRELIEREIIVKTNGQWVAREATGDVEVPGSLQALLLSRIDRLPEEAKQTLRVASVVGRQFAAGVLAEVMGTPLMSQLATLEAAGLIQIAPVQGELEYLFQHTLLHEAAYRSLLRNERHRLHFQVGEALERQYGDRLEELAATLGHHFQQGKDWQRALQYYERAGNHAQQRHALAEAAAHYSQALAAADQLEQHPISLYRSRGQVYEVLGRFEGARADHERALELARTAGHRREEWQALLDLGFLWVARDYERGGVYFQEALAIAQEMGEPRLLAHSLNRLGNWHVNMERLEEGRQNHEEALAIFQRLDDRQGVAETLDLLSLAASNGGDLPQTTSYLEQAITLFRELGDRRGLSSSLASTVNFVPPLGEPRHGALERATEALAIAREIDWPAGEAYALSARATVLTEEGAYDRAFETVHQTVRIAESIGHHQWATAGHTQLGQIYLDLLALPQARHHLEVALDLARQTGSQYWIEWITGILGRAYIRQGEFALAEALLGGPDEAGEPVRNLLQAMVVQARSELALARGDPARALELLDRDYGLSTETGRGRQALFQRVTALLRANTLIAIGRLEEAEMLLEEINERADGLAPAGWRIERSVGLLLHARGRPDEATGAFGRARTIIENLAAGLSEASLRESFLRAAVAHLTPDDAIVML